MHELENLSQNVEMVLGLMTFEATHITTILKEL